MSGGSFNYPHYHKLGDELRLWSLEGALALLKEHHPDSLAARDLARVIGCVYGLNDKLEKLKYILCTLDRIPSGDDIPADLVPDVEVYERLAPLPWSPEHQTMWQRIGAYMILFATPPWKVRR